MFYDTPHQKKKNSLAWQLGYFSEQGRLVLDFGVLNAMDSNIDILTFLFMLIHQAFTG